MFVSGKLQVCFKSSEKSDERYATDIRVIHEFYKKKILKSDCFEHWTALIISMDYLLALLVGRRFNELPNDISYMQNLCLTCSKEWVKYDLFIDDSLDSIK